MELNLNETVNLEDENMDRETQASEGDMLYDEFYDEGIMMPYDMEQGYGYGIMPYGTQQSPGQGTIPYGSYQMPSQDTTMPYGSYQMPSQSTVPYGMYDAAPYWMQSSPIMYGGMYPQAQSTQSMYRQSDLLPLLLFGLATGYTPYYTPYYPTYYPPYYPPYYSPYYGGGYHHHRVDE